MEEIQERRRFEILDNRIKMTSSSGSPELRVGTPPVHAPPLQESSRVV